LRSAGPVAALSSGGLDSSGVAATAALLCAPSPLSVYTRVPPPGFTQAETDRKYFSERSKVEALGRMHPNMAITFVADAGLHAYDSDPTRIFAHFGFPALGVHNFGWFSQLHDRVTAAGHRVLLTGGSGNYSLGWHGKHSLHQLVTKGHWLRAAKHVIDLKRVSGATLAMTLSHYILGAYEPAFLRKLRRHWRGIGAGHENNTFLSPAFEREHRLAERVEKIGGWNDELRWGDPFDERVRWLLNGREHGRDIRAQCLAINGFEMRDPLGDPRLIEFSLNVPEEHFIRKGRRRALQRDVIADRVPPEIGENTKHGEQTPEWFERLTMRRETILANIERIAQSPLAARAIDVDGLRKAAQDWPADAEAAGAAGPKFRYGVARAVHLGNFICWFEGGNR
jgi:asparagine synthase (glutamine-hydrolysing)